MDESPVREKIEKMVFRTISPTSCMDGKEGLYLFITLVWGILILLTDYRHTGPIVHGAWISFGLFLILVSIYIFITYCVYPVIFENIFSKIIDYLFSNYTFRDLMNKFKELIEKFLRSQAENIIVK